MEAGEDEKKTREKKKKKKKGKHAPLYWTAVIAVSSPILSLFVIFFFADLFAAHKSLLVPAVSRRLLAPELTHYLARMKSETARLKNEVVGENREVRNSCRAFPRSIHGGRCFTGARCRFIREGDELLQCVAVTNCIKNTRYTNFSASEFANARN